MKNTIFAHRLKTLRKDRKITQKTLAEALGISLSSVVHYENSQRFPVAGIISLMAMYFDVSKEYLLGETEDPKPLDSEDTEIIKAINDEFQTLLENLLSKFNTTTDENKKNLFDIVSELNSIMGTKNISDKLKARTLATLKHDAYRENQFLKMHSKVE